MNRTRRLLLAALAYALSLLVPVPGFSSAQWEDERAVRAAYLFNLTKLVVWPPQTNGLVIGVLGNRETGEFLQTMLDGKSSDARTIHVVLFPSDNELRQCNILYFADSAKIRSTLDKLENNNVVTVGEADSFAEDGGMVALIKVGEHIQIQVNQEAAQRAGVKLSSGLLNLAQVIQPKSPAEHGQRRIVQRHEPDYPDIAAKMALHGTVKVKAWIAPDGTVRRVECVGGHPLLAVSALQAVKSWKYEPAAQESAQVIDVKF